MGEFLKLGLPNKTSWDFWACTPISEPWMVVCRIGHKVKGRIRWCLDYLFPCSSRTPAGMLFFTTVPSTVWILRWAVPPRKLGWWGYPVVKTVWS